MDQTYLAYSRIRQFMSSEVNTAKIGLIFSTGNKHRVWKRIHPPYLNMGGLQTFKHLPVMVPED